MSASPSLASTPDGARVAAARLAAASRLPDSASAAALLAAVGGAPGDDDAAFVDVAGVRVRVRARARSHASNAHANAHAHDAAAPAVVLTPSSRANLRRLAFATSLADAMARGGGGGGGGGACARPGLLEGPPGSGKTTLLRHLARAAGAAHDMVELHLDDAADGKALLGAYVCTDVPGEFRWQAGAVTAAVQQGRWVLIEDVDRAPFEVLAALAPLLEARTLLLPGRARPVVAHPDIQLLATRSCAVLAGAGAVAVAGAGAGGDDEGAAQLRLQPISGPLAHFSDRWFRVPFAPLGGGGDGLPLLEPPSGEQLAEPEGL